MSTLAIIGRSLAAALTWGSIQHLFRNGSRTTRRVLLAIAILIPVLLLTALLLKWGAPALLNAWRRLRRWAKPRIDAALGRVSGGRFGVRTHAGRSVPVSQR